MPDCKLPEDYLKKVEICRSISELYVKMYFNTYTFVGVDKLLNYSSGVCPKGLKNNMNRLGLTADHRDHI